MDAVNKFEANMTSEELPVEVVSPNHQLHVESNGRPSFQDTLKRQSMTNHALISPKQPMRLSIVPPPLAALSNKNSV